MLQIICETHFYPDSGEEVHWHWYKRYPDEAWATHRGYSFQCTISESCQHPLNRERTPLFRQPKKELESLERRILTLLVEMENIPDLIGDSDSEEVMVKFAVGCAENVVHKHQEIFPGDHHLEGWLTLAEGFIKGRVPGQVILLTLQEARDYFQTSSASIAAYAALGTIVAYDANMDPSWKDNPSEEARAAAFYAARATVKKAAQAASVAALYAAEDIDAEQKRQREFLNSLIPEDYYQ